MSVNKLVLDLKSSSRFTQSSLHNQNTIENNYAEYSYIGGVIQNGQLSWIARGAQIEIHSMQTGAKVSSYTFDNHLPRPSNTLVTCVSELNVNGKFSGFLAIGVQCYPVGGLVYIYTVHGSRIIHRIEVIDKVTSCSFINITAGQEGKLQRFDGCIVVGTDSGKVILLDLNYAKCKEVFDRHEGYCYEKDIATCHIVLSSMKYDDMIAHHNQAQQENINFGIQLGTLDEPSAILSILYMQPLRTIAVGFEEGQMLLYNLNDLQAIHLAHPPEIDASLIKLNYLEPADDPRACVYVWAFHAHQDTAVAVMHSIVFETKALQGDSYMYEHFQSCSPRLTIPICEKGSCPIACQSVSKIVTDEEDEILTLCLLAWTSQKSSSFMFVFDLNQWYKEQMPHVCDWREYPSFLAPFPVEGNELPLDIWLNAKSVVTFSSIQRPEEHFYPSSLTFECVKLTPKAFFKLKWPGLQNKALNKFSARGAVAILEPDECFSDILDASLIPQFSENNYHANPLTSVKREFLLSMALEYNCIGLLKECAKLWADGSHQGNQLDGLALSTLTEWIWARACVIRDCCNSLCVPLFDHSGCTLDLRSKKILSHCLRQLKRLADLLQMIVSSCRQYIPKDIYDQLFNQSNSIQMMYQYQNVLQWMLNMGLLPEVAWNPMSRPGSQLSLSVADTRMLDGLTPVPYPYPILHEYYAGERQKFLGVDSNSLKPRTRSCKWLYIDAFIERECNSRLLREEWSHGPGDELYPPPSLQAMLRVLLIPGIPLDSKYILFVYLFLDLNMALDDERYARVVQNLIRFPAAFELNSSLIKTTQAFWNLDHREYQTAVDELVTPFLNSRPIAQWQQELLVSSLLLRGESRHALRPLRSPGPRISPELHIKVLFANDLVTEAYQLQRNERNESLLLEFYKICHEYKKWDEVLGLALSEKEGEVLEHFLRSCNSPMADNILFVYLLQHDKNIEALSFLDKRNRHRPQNKQINLLASCLKLAMNSTEKEFCELYLKNKELLDHDDQFRIDSAANVESAAEGPVPLSVHLNKQFMSNKSTNFEGIFRRAVQNAKFVSHSMHVSTNQPTKSHYPLLSRHRIDFNFHENNNYRPAILPSVYMPQSKRRLMDSFEEKEEYEIDRPAAKRKRIESFRLETEQRSKMTPLERGSMLSMIEVQSDGSDDDASHVNLLSTPVVSTSRFSKGSPMRSERDRPQTPQSILKIRRTDGGSCSQSRRSVSPTLTVGSARRSVDFDEKSFRYSQSQRQYTVLDISDDVPLTTIPESADHESDSNSTSNSSYIRRIKARPPIHSSRDVSIASSADEYYSPENSKRSELEDALQNASDSSPGRTNRQINFDAKRQSTSDSRESTPESEGRLTRSRSRTLQQLDEHELDEKQVDVVFGKTTSSTPYVPIKSRGKEDSYKSPKKPLSRIVVESSARKLIARRMTDEKSDISSTAEKDDDFVSQRLPESVLSDRSTLNESDFNKYFDRYNDSILSSSASSYNPKYHEPEHVLNDSSFASTKQTESAVSTVTKLITIETAKVTTSRDETDEVIIHTAQIAKLPSLIVSEPQDVPLVEFDQSDSGTINNAPTTPDRVSNLLSTSNVTVTKSSSKMSLSRIAIEANARKLIGSHESYDESDKSLVTDPWMSEGVLSDRSISDSIYHNYMNRRQDNTSSSMETSYFNRNESMSMLTPTSSFEIIPGRFEKAAVQNSNPTEMVIDNEPSEVPLVNVQKERDVESKISDDETEKASIDSANKSSKTKTMVTDVAQELNVNTAVADDPMLSSTAAEEKETKSTTSNSSDTDKYSDEDSSSDGVSFEYAEDEEKITIDESSNDVINISSSDESPTPSPSKITANRIVSSPDSPDNYEFMEVDALPSESMTFSEMIYGDLDLQTPLEYDNPEPSLKLSETESQAENRDFNVQSVLNNGQIVDGSESNLIEGPSAKAEESIVLETRLNTQADFEQASIDQSSLQTADLLNQAILNEDSRSHTPTEVQPQNSDVTEPTNSEQTIEAISQKSLSTNDHSVEDAIGTPKRPIRSNRRSMSTEPKNVSTRETDEPQPSTSKDNSQVTKAITRPKSRTRSNSVNTEQIMHLDTTNLRSTRAKSASITNLSVESTPTKFKSSTSSLDVQAIEAEIDETRTTPSRPKTRRMSQLLDSVLETPKSTPNRRRKTISESSDMDKSANTAEEKEDAIATPRRRKARDISDTESIVSTRSRKSIDRSQADYETPTTRSKTRQLEETSPNSLNSDSPSTRPRSTRRAGSKQIDDDANSETSSMISSRSQTRRKGVTTPVDDDLLERSSIKSGRSTRRSVRATSIINLPSIAENPGDASNISSSTQNMDALTSSRRLTRAQLATMEKYKSIERNVAASLTPTRMRLRRDSAATEGDGDDRDESIVSDSESIVSKNSNVSKMSKTSKASKSSKVSKRGRPTKNQ